MRNTNQFWLIIHPHVFVSKIGLLQVLLYNSKNGNFIEVINSEIISLIDLLHEEKNLGSILLDKNIIDNKIIYSFIEEAKLKDICDTVHYQDTSLRPIQLMPVLSIQKDIERLRMQSHACIGEGILNYLTEITIFVNNQCNCKCKFCNDAYKQFTCCNSSIQNQCSLNQEELKSIAFQISQAPINRINIVGGDLNEYKHISELIDIFNENNHLIHLWEYYRTNILKFDGFIDVLVDFPIEADEFNLMMSKMKIEKTTFHFIITNIDEVSKVEQIVAKNMITSFELHPLYNKENIAFFEKIYF